MRASSRTLCLPGVFIALVMIAFPACSQQPGEASAEGRVTSSGPVGLFFMSRYWVSTRSLERVAWYFTADHQVYSRLETGLTAADLAAHQGRKGISQFEGNQLQITWADGKVNKRELRPGKAGNSFEWDGALFVAVPPISDNRLVVGKFGTGLSLVGKGMGTLVSNTLELRADGTYAKSGAPLVKGSAKGNVTPTGGTWKAESYSITLTGSDGSVTRKLAFPYFENDKDPVPSHLFLGGVLMKRQ